MWVYSGASLKNRLKLDPKLGYWLDYWLFLHADETHPIWSTRPFGIKAIAHAITKTELQGGHDGVLRRQLEKEVNQWLQLDQFLNYQDLGMDNKKRPTLIPGNNGSNQYWDSPWKEWFEDVSNNLDFRKLASQIIEHLSASLIQDNYERAAFLTQQLGSELGDVYTRKHIFQSTKSLILDSGNYSQILDQQGLAAAIEQGVFYGEESEYVVSVRVSPIIISNSIRTRGEGRRAKPITVKLTDKSQERTRLDGYECRVSASHPEEALMKSLEPIRFAFRAISF